MAAETTTRSRIVTPVGDVVVCGVAESRPRPFATRTSVGPQRCHSVLLIDSRRARIHVHGPYPRLATTVEREAGTPDQLFDSRGRMHKSPEAIPLQSPL